MAGILIIDDHSPSRDRVRAVAGSLELPVCAEFRSGEEALTRLGDDCPELIIVDVHPPGAVDGIELIRRLREEAPDATIIACGLFDDAATVSEAFEAGAHRCLRKPLRNEDLVRLLEKHRAQAAPYLT
ncbi:MAG TPA: response regulator [Candidatus Krumholzibacteria bacterium]